MPTPNPSRRRLLTAVAVAISISGCGGGDADDSVAGTWIHPEEGTIVLDSDGSGTLTQSGDPVAFDWTVDGDTVSIDVDGDPATAPDAVAEVSGDELTFRVGDFSGDEPVTFTRR